MKARILALVAMTLGLQALPVVADRTDVLYSYKHWQVEGISYDDGTYACVAEGFFPTKPSGCNFTLKNGILAKVTRRI
jgi:hypothetical protein